MSVEGNLSKGMWKTMCNKFIERHCFLHSKGSFGNIKPDAGICNWLDQKPLGLFRTLLSCRHDTLGVKMCKCQLQPVFNVPLHLTLECKIMHNIVARLPLEMFINDNIKEANKLPNIQKLHYFLGKPMERASDSVNNALRVATAKYLNEAVKELV